MGRCELQDYAVREARMCNADKSSLKRIRQTESRRLRNRYYEKTARTAVRRIRKMTDKAEAQAALSKVTALLDKLARKNTISKRGCSIIMIPGGIAAVYEHVAVCGLMVFL